MSYTKETLYNNKILPDCLYLNYKRKFNIVKVTNIDGQNDGQYDIN